MEKIDYSKFYGKLFCMKCKVLTGEDQYETKEIKIRNYNPDSSKEFDKTKVKRCKKCSTDIHKFWHPLWYALFWYNLIGGGCFFIGHKIFYKIFEDDRLLGEQGFMFLASLMFFVLGLVIIIGMAIARLGQKKIIAEIASET